MPRDNEVFKQRNDCVERLLYQGFTRGCIFVKGGHRSSPSPARWYFCQYYGKKIQNNRDLKPQVRKDTNRNIVGSSLLMGRKEYYNLTRRQIKDVPQDLTASALLGLL